jgi:hypothetical protein
MVPNVSAYKFLTVLMYRFKRNAVETAVGEATSSAICPLLPNAFEETHCIQLYYFVGDNV